MISILASKSRIGKLNNAERDEISAALLALKDGYGNPHMHAGMGIGRLRKDLFECRAGLHWRVILFAEKGVLTAYDVNKAPAAK